MVSCVNSFCLLIVFLLSSMGCSLQKMALNSSADLFTSASHEIETETDYELFKQALPSFLKTVEGLHFLDSTDLSLSLSVIKSRVANAYLIYETEMARFEPDSKKFLYLKKKALSNYKKAYQVGSDYLKSHGVSLKDIKSMSRKTLKQDELYDYYSSRIGDSKKSLDLLMFFSQAWMAMINLERDNPRMLLQLGFAKSLFDWTCTLRPNQHNGVCDLFDAVYTAERPKMLGGGRVLAEKKFKSLMEKYPKNVFYKVSYVQYIIVPQKNKKELNQQKRLLSKIYEDFLEFQTTITGLKSDNFFKDAKANINLVNAVGLERFKIIAGNKNNF